MRKLTPTEENALHFLASVGEFTLPDDPATNRKAAAIAAVMKSLVRKRLALVIDTSDDTPPRPRWGITEAGWQAAGPVH